MSNRTNPDSLGILDAPQGKGGILVFGNGNDVYTFTLTNSTQVQVKGSSFALTSVFPNSARIRLNLAKDNNNNGELDSSEIFETTTLPSAITNQEVFNQLLAAGTYFVELRAFGFQDFFETTYTFDLIPVGVSPNPNPNPNPEPADPADLTGKSFSVIPDVLFAGETFSSQFIVGNDGETLAQSSRVDFYLSDNSIISTSDEKLGEVTISAVNPSTNTDILHTFLTLPSLGDSFWDSSTTYYVGMIVDAGNDVSESSGTNNRNQGNFIDKAPIQVLLTTPEQYGASNPDLIATYGYNPSAFAEHYRNAGRFENRSVNSFDYSQYLASNPDLIAVFGNNSALATQHYIASGFFENRSVNSFDYSQYLASNPDLIAVFGNNPALATQHYITSGFWEGRTLDAFPEKLYLGSHDDLLQVFGADLNAATQHYINSGWAEQRTFDRFNPSQYLASHDDLIFAFGNNPNAALDHFIYNGYAEGRSRDNFAEDIYLASHGDLIQAFGYNLEAATQHYISAGALEGRGKSLFDPVSYLSKYSDLQAAFGNDLTTATWHYISYGFWEGRTWV